MKLYVLLPRREPSCPLRPSPAICVLANGRLPPDTEPGLWGTSLWAAWGQRGPRSTATPQGKLRGKGKPILSLWFLREQKQSQNQKEREPQTLPAAADEESHFGKYLSKTKTKQKPKKMVV